MVHAENITVVDTESAAGLAGVYSFSVATVRDVYARNVTFQGSLVFLFFSQADSANLYLGNSTLTIGGFHACYSSNSHMRNLTTDVGIAGYLRKPTPLYNVIGAFASNVTLIDCHFVVPPVANSPAFYLWGSSLYTQSLTFTALYANFINAFDHSNGTVFNVTIGNFQAQSLALVFKSRLRLDTVTLQQGQMRASAFIALSHAQVFVTRFVILRGGFEFLVSAAQSSVILVNLTLPALSANTFFTDISRSYIEVTEMTLTDSVFDLTQLYSSQLVLHSVGLSNIHIRRRFLILVNSTLTFEECTLHNFSAVTETPLCTASKNSSLNIVSTRMSGVWSLEQDLMHFSNSAMLLRASLVTHYNATFVSGKLSQMVIESSTIQEGGLQRKARGGVTAGFIDCSVCSVTLRNSCFAGVSGTSGGAVSLTSSSLSVEACQLLSGSASGRGGFVSAVNSNVTVMSSRFEGGQATVGGALFFSCESASVCQCHISQTNFSGHSALEGGAVYWTKVRPSYFSILAVNNTAVYGPFEASLPTNVSLISARQATLYGVAGINVIHPILIGFFDEIGQLVTTDNSSSAELESEHIIGTTSLIAQGGIANFSSILLHAYPGDSVQIQVQSRSINDTFPHSRWSSLLLRIRHPPLRAWRGHHCPRLLPLSQKHLFSGPGGY